MKDVFSMQILFIVWVDLPDAYGQSSSDASGAKHYVFFQPPGGGRPDWEAEMPYGADVSVKVNHAKYDLAEGRLFLMTTRGGQTQVRQLKRDLSGVKPNTGDFERLAKEDADVAEFVAAAGD
jgi:hypothetical protein